MSEYVVTAVTIGMMMNLLGLLCVGAASGFRPSTHPSFVSLPTLRASTVQFDLSGLMNLFQGTTKASRTDKARATLFDAIAVAKLKQSVEAEEAVRVAFSELEQAAPAPLNLLDDPVASKALDGTWLLDYTIAAFSTSEDKASPVPIRRGKQGTVNATGINVDTTAEGVITTQTFDVAQGRIFNNILKPVKFLGKEITSQLQVAGTIRRRYVELSRLLYVAYLHQTSSLQSSIWTAS